MSQNIADSPDEVSRVLLVSMRNLKFHVSRSAPYEFEDVICDCDTVDLITPTFNPTLFKITNKLANSSAKFFKNGRLIKSLINYKFEVNNLGKKGDLIYQLVQ